MLPDGEDSVFDLSVPEFYRQIVINRIAGQNIPMAFIYADDITYYLLSDEYAASRMPKHTNNHNCRYRGSNMFQGVTLIRPPRSAKLRNRITLAPL